MTDDHGKDWFRLAFERAPIGMALVGLDGRWQRVNRSLCELLGYPEDELLGLTFGDVTHPDDLKATLQLAAELDAGRAASGELEKRYVRKDGSAIWARLSVATLHDASGKQLARIAQIVDLTHRRQAEEGLREAESRYRRLVESLPLTTYVDRVDATQSSVYISPQIEALLGYPASAWLEDPRFLEKIVHPDDRASLIEGGWPDQPGPHQSEYRLLAKDGRVVWFLDGWQLHGDDAGTPTVQGYMLDITDRKRAEDELRRRDQILQAVAISASHLLSATHFEPTIEEVLGSLGTAAGVTGAWLFDLTLDGALERSTWAASGREHDGDRRDVPADTPGLDAMLVRFRAGEHFEAHAPELPRPLCGAIRDPRIQSLVAVPIFVSGRLCGFVGLDESRGERAFAPAEIEALRAAAGMLGAALERKRIETARLEAENFYRALVDASPAGIIALGLDETVTLWNASAERIYGWSADEVLGKPLPTLLPEVEDEYRRSFDAVRRGGEIESYETRRRRKDGATIDISISIAPRRDGTGKIVGTFAVHLDISGAKALERQLLHSQRMEAVGRLAGGIAHDFNNLLTAIRGYADFLCEDLDAGSRAHGDATEIVRTAERAAALVRQLLAFSRRQVLRPEVIDLNEVVRDTDSMLGRLIGEEIKVVAELASDLPAISADAGNLVQVLLNLAMNGRDAMPAGGLLRIRTERVVAEARAGNPVELEPGPYACLMVEDTGIGMDADIRSRVFEPFFTTKPEGTGLGLATVYGIVAQSGGHIELESEPGRGTSFRIYFPATEPVPPVRGVPVPPVPERRQGSETILLVEDEDVVRALAARVLSDRGYQVLEAASGAEALRISDEFASSIDLLLTDVVMPGMSGRELSERLVEQRPETDIVFMSGYNEDVVLREGIENGSWFLGKPFAPPALADLVRTVLDARHGKLS